MPLALSWALITLLLAPPASADAITFDRAIELARVAPEVRGAERALDVKRRSRQNTSRITYNPQIMLQPGFRLAPADARGLEVQASLTQTWSLAGLARARDQALRSEEELWSAEARLIALSRGLGAARAWIDLWATQQLWDEARAEAAIAATFTATIERANALSAATLADVADARAYVSEADLLVLAAEGEVFHLGLLLNQETGSTRDAPLAAEGPLPAPPLPSAAEYAGALDRADQLPQIAALELSGRVAQARAAEIKAAYGAHLLTGVFFQRDQPGGVVPYAIVGLTLPVFNRGERERGEALAAAERLAGAAEQARVDARAELAQAIHEVEHSQRIWSELERHLVPAQQAATAARERLFAAGQATVVEVLLARRAAIQGRARRHRAAADHAWARVKLWILLATIERHGAPK